MKDNTEAGKIRILVAEDSPTQAMNLQFLLERNGYEVTVVSDGEAALTAAAAGTPPELILTDIVMPGISGYELCRRAKADSRLAHIPVVLLTTLSDPLNVIDGLQCGADSFVVKPYNPDLLLSRIRYIFDNRTLRRVREPETNIEVSFSGRTHTFTARRSQMLDLLLSTFENAVQKNIELVALNKRLMEAEQQLAIQATELEALALTDRLTGLLNRRGFTTIASKQVEIASRDGQYMWLLYIDIDGLQSVNDVLGSDEGDRLLSDAGMLLKETARESDIVARIGGDEFAVLIVHGSSDNAQRLWMRLKEAAVRHNETAARSYVVSFRVGIADYNPDKSHSLDDLIARAHSAMQQDQSGRSQDEIKRTVRPAANSV